MPNSLLKFAGTGLVARKLQISFNLDVIHRRIFLPERRRFGVFSLAESIEDLTGAFFGVKE